MSSELPRQGSRSLLAVLQADWRAMLLDEESKDFQIVVGDKNEKFTFHKIVLLARCEKLKRENLVGKELVLQQVDSEAMQKIQHYLYTAEIDLTDATDLCPLLQVCHIFGLSSLQSYLLQCLELLLSVDNVCAVLSSAHEIASTLGQNDDDEELVQDMWIAINVCLQYITRHKTNVLNSDGFLKLSRETMIVFVSSKLQIGTQELLKAVLSWARFKVGTSKVLQSDWSEEERENVRVHAEGVVKHIHVANGRMSPDSVTDGVYGILERYSWAESSFSEVSFPDSNLLAGRLNLQAQLKQWCGYEKQPWILLYRGSHDGFRARDFHARCDNFGPTVVIVQSSSGHIFGGYSDVPWSSNHRRGRYISSHSSFLFSLVNPFLDTPPTQFRIQQPSYAINNHPQSGPIFGSGADLCLSSNCHLNEESYSNFPSSYGSDKLVDPNYLAGKKYFVVQDYEVFGVQL